MAINEADLPKIIIERLEAYHPAPAIFSADEIVDWPEGIISDLQTAGLVQPAERAEFIICDGCHWGCMKPVVVRKQKGSARAFIVCDEGPDLGRIEVSLERPQQYLSSLSLLAGFLRNSLGLDARAPLSGLLPLFLGRVKGRYGDHSVSLLLRDGKLALQIGSHSRSVIEFLICRQGQLTADKVLLRRLADRKHSITQNRPRYQPNRIKQARQASATAQRNRAIRKEAFRMQRETGKTMSDISRIFAVQRRFFRTGEGKQPPLTAKRIYRIIYDQADS